MAIGNKPFYRETDLFTSGTEGYRRFRIPGLVVSPNNVLMAFCEAHKGPKLSDGQDLALRRSFDNGRTWGPIQYIARGGILGSACPVVDHQTGAVWLVHDGTPTFSWDDRDIFVISSTDDGETWSAPRRIMSDTTEPGWVDLNPANGVHGIQLKSGRIAVTAYHKVPEGKNPEHFFAYLIYSDDHGKTWRHSGEVPAHSEATIVETRDGSLYMSLREHARLGQFVRSHSWSRDGGTTWSPIEFDEALKGPSCHAGMTRFTFQDTQSRLVPLLQGEAFAGPAAKGEGVSSFSPSTGEMSAPWPTERVLPSAIVPLPQGEVGRRFGRPGGGVASGRNRVLLSQPASRNLMKREHLKVFMSYDECKTWPVSRLLHAGPAAYSDLAVGPDMTILIPS